MTLTVTVTATVTQDGTRPTADVDDDEWPAERRFLSRRVSVMLTMLIRSL